MKELLQQLFKREQERWRNNNDYAEVLRSSGVTFLLRFLSFALVYLLQLLIARIYGAGAVGVFHLTVTLVTIGSVLITFGTDTSLVRLIPELRTQQSVRLIPQLVRSVSRFCTLWAVIIGMGLFCAADWLAREVFSQEQLTLPLQISALLLPFIVLTRLYAAAFRGEKKASSSIWFEILAIRVLHIAGLLLLTILFPDASLDVIYSFAAAVAITALWSVVAWQRQYAGTSPDLSSAAGRKSDERIGLGQVLALSLPMYLSSTMVLVMDWTDTFLLGVYTTPEVVGIYSIVLRLSLLTSFAFVSINTILLPKIAELYWSGDLTRLQQLVATSNRLLFWSSVPVLATLMVFAGSLLSLFGTEFAVGRLPLIILCLGHFVSCIAGNVISLLIMTGHHRMARNALMCAAATNILGNCLLIPTWGMYGAAVATSLSMIVRDLLATRFASRLYGFPTWYLPTRLRRFGAKISLSANGERR